MKRKINIIGDIDQAAYLAFAEKLDELSLSKTPIEIELCSDGGDACAALAFHDKIKLSPNDIIITATGLVASAAVLILAAGDIRRITANAWVMVHEDTVPLNENARVAEIEKDVAHARRLEHQWCDLLSKATGVPSDVWAKLHRVETYLSSKECFELNLVETII